MRILIVGSGVIGVSTAFFLQSYGHDVTVIDRAGGPGMETSFANGALLTPSLAEPWNEPGILGVLLRSLGRKNSATMLRAKAIPSLLGWGLQFLKNSKSSRFQENTFRNFRLADYSLDIMAGLRDQLELDFDHSRPGIIKLFRNEATMELATRRARLLRDHGVSYEALDPEQVITLEPALEPIVPHIAGGLYYPRDELGDAQKFCVQLCQITQKMGASFQFSREVDGFQMQGDRITGAVCGGETVTADAYLLAAGSFSTQLVKSVKVRLPMRPVKGYSLTIPAGEWPDAPRIPVLDDQLHAVVVPLGKHIRTVGTAEFTAYDLSIPPARIDNLMSLLGELYPRFTAGIDPQSITSWTGLRAMSADGVPILGRTKYSNFYLNTGHGHLGWTMAAGTGKLVADVIVGNDPDIEPNDYELSRFH